MIKSALCSLIMCNDGAQSHNKNFQMEACSKLVGSNYCVIACIRKGSIVSVATYDLNYFNEASSVT